MARPFNPTSAEAPLAGAPTTVFQLQANENAGAGLSRIMLEQIDLAMWHASRITKADEHVHGVRLVAKRSRAVLRLARDGLGAEPYRDLNAAFRDLARGLSESRTATVRLMTLDALIEWRPAAHAGRSELHDALTADVDRTRLGFSATATNDLIAGLERAQSGVENWTLPALLNPTQLGLGKTYRRGRQGMRRAHRTERNADFHEWRKRVKYLRHQMEVLSGMEPERMTAIALGFSDLGDLLGLEHDLTDLEHVAADHPDGDGRDRLIAAIDDRRSELRSEMRPLAQDLLTRKPTEFVQDMNASWEAWRNEPGKAAS